MPGYLLEPFTISADVENTEMEVSYRIPASLVDEYEKQGKELKFFYFDEEEGLMKEVENQEIIKGDSRTRSQFYIITFRVHFSFHIHFQLLIADDFYLRFDFMYEFLFEWSIIIPKESAGIVLLFDSSKNMSQEPNRDIVHPFAYKVVDYFLTLDPDNKFAILDFAFQPLWYSSLVSNKSTLNYTIRAIESGFYGDISDIQGALTRAQTIFTDDDGSKHFILITQGKADSTSQYNNIIDSAKAKGIKIHVVQVNTDNISHMERIASETGGEYIQLTNESQIPDATEFLYEKICGKTNTDFVTDTDNDGIPDFYEESINKGSILLGNGQTLAELPHGNIKKLDINNPDTDGDGISDGEELQMLFMDDSITGDEKYDLKNFKAMGYHSNPLLKDSDYDGLSDLKEKNDGTKPLSPTKPNAELMGNKEGVESYSYNLPYEVDYRWFFRDNTKYNEKLSKLSSIFATLAYYKSSAPDVEVASNPKIYSMRVTEDSSYMTLMSFMETHGFSDVKEYNLDPKIDQHVVQYNIGSQLVSYKGENKLIISVPIRGTYESLEEWTSNFEIGADSDPTSNAGWTNKDNHKGFDIVANRIVESLETYTTDVSSKYNGEFEVVYWITGHSRGAATSNLVAQKLEEKGEKTFTYTFATPNTTTSKDVEKYKSIFNIISNEDAIVKAPFYEKGNEDKWGFTKYGVTLVQDTATDAQKEIFQDRLGQEYSSNKKLVNSLIHSIAKFAISREEAYEYQKKLDYTFSYPESKEEAAWAIFKEVTILTAPKYSKPYQEQRMVDLQYPGKFVHKQSPMFLMQLIPDFIHKSYENDLDILDIVKSLSYVSPKAYPELAAILVKSLCASSFNNDEKTGQISNAIAYPHYADSYIILSEISDFSGQVEESILDEYTQDDPIRPVSDTGNGKDDENDKAYFTGDTKILVYTDENRTTDYVEISKLAEPNAHENYKIKVLRNDTEPTIATPGSDMLRINNMIDKFQGAKVIYEITMGVDTFSCVAEQTFYLKDVGWTAASLLKVGDHIRLSGKDTYIEIDEIEEGLSSELYSFDFGIKHYYEFFVSEKGVATISFQTLKEDYFSLLRKKVTEDFIKDAQKKDKNVNVDDNTFKEEIGLKADKLILNISNLHVEMMKDVFKRARVGPKVGTTKPAAAGVMDKHTGEIIYIGYNINQDEREKGYPKQFIVASNTDAASVTDAIKEINVIRARADFINTKIDNDPWEPQGCAGSHAEVHAVAQALFPLALDDNGNVLVKNNNKIVEPGTNAYANGEIQYDDSLTPRKKEDFIIFVFQSERNKEFGEPFHTCAHCNFILDGFNILSEEPLSEPNKYFYARDLYKQKYKSMASETDAQKATP